MPTRDNYIGIDRRFALLVIIDTLRRNLSIQKIKKTLLASVVKNSSLIYWYPESRELPKGDEHFEINPWVSDIFNVDLRKLEEAGFVELEKHAIKETEMGRSFAAGCIKFPQYLKFKDEVLFLYREEKKSGFFSTPRFCKNLIKRSKNYKDEVLYYDYLSLKEKFPIGISIEPNKITSYLDIKAWLSSIIRRIKKGEVMRAPSNKLQIEFLKDVCEKYRNAPLAEVPLIEICGQCVEYEIKYGEKQGTKFTIFVEGETIEVIAQNFTADESVIYHSFRVVGIPRVIHGSIKVEAIQIFDRGKHYPTNHRIL